jgi:hypothetical protein
MNSGRPGCSLGQAAKSAIGDLDRALCGPDQPLPVVAAMALLKISPDDARARVAAAMSAFLTDYSHPFAHSQAVGLLKRIVGEEELANRLAPMLKSQDRLSRDGALADLTWHCPSAKNLTGLPQGRDG